MARSSRPLVAGRYRLIGYQNGVSLFEREATPMGNRHLLRPSQSWEARVRPRSALPAEDGQNPLHRDEGRANMYE